MAVVDLCRGIWKAPDIMTGEEKTLACPVKEKCYRYRTRPCIERENYFDKVPWSILSDSDVMSDNLDMDEIPCRYFMKYT
jgi:hypothetical protein